jgi:hypothetical protein
VVKRDLQGTIEKDFTPAESIAGLLENMQKDRLTASYVVLNEGDEPSDMNGIMYIGGTLILGAVTFTFWMILLISVLTSLGQRRETNAGP